MDITLNREAILAACTRPAAVADGRSLPILGHLLCQASDGRLTLTGSNLEIEIGVHCHAQVDTEGECTLPARKLLDITRALSPGADLRLRLTGERCQITAGRSRFTLSTLPVADFPVSETPSAHVSRLQVTTGDLARLFGRTAYAMAKNDVRYYLNGIFLTLDEAALRAVATDGHRLASSVIPLAAIDGPPIDVILPESTVRELSRAIVPSTDLVTLELTERLMRIAIGPLTFTSKLIAARYPDWRRVIPTNLERSATIDRGALLQALSRTGILSSDTYRGVRASFAPGVLRLNAANIENEESQEEVDCLYDHDAVTIGYNIAYLSDALRSISADQIALNFIDGHSSTRIEVPDAPDDIRVVMPMRL